MCDARDCGTDATHPGREDTWKAITSREWIAGVYQRACFEHRGEAAWHRICSASGAVDLYLQRKDAFMQNKSLWTDDPMIHILPHWNHLGLEGRKINVWVYTNCDEAELFLNGESFGKKRIEALGHGEWDVVYPPGELKAVGYKNDKEAISFTHRTPGKAYALILCEET